MTRIARLSMIPAVAAALTLGACQRPASRTQPSPATTAALNACRAETDRVYAAQNRVDLSTRDERDTPFAANYLPGVTTRGLGARYGRDNMLGSCLDNVGAPRPAASSATTGSTPGPTFSPVAR